METGVAAIEANVELAMNAAAAGEKTIAYLATTLEGEDVEASEDLSKGDGSRYKGGVAVIAVAFGNGLAKGQRCGRIPHIEPKAMGTLVERSV